MKIKIQHTKLMGHRASSVQKATCHCKAYTTREERAEDRRGVHRPEGSDPAGAEPRAQTSKPTGSHHGPETVGNPWGCGGRLLLPRRGQDPSVGRD